MTWSPVTGCTKISPGCLHCYIERTPPMRMAGRGFDQKGRIPVELHPSRLSAPLRWKKPRMVFVNSMSDLFHPDVPFNFIDDVFAVMALVHRHTFQVLTKRPERMARYFDGGNREIPIKDDWSVIIPLPHVWLGFSGEDQERFDKRWAIFRGVPATVAMVSLEPLLGQVVLPPEFLALGSRAWVIAGGESGPGARPAHPGWFRSVRDQCKAAGVPFFMKQIMNAKGRKIPFDEWPGDLKIREYPAGTG